MKDFEILFEETKESHSHTYLTKEDIEKVVDLLQRKECLVEFQEPHRGGNGIPYRFAYVWKDDSRKSIAANIAECTFWHADGRASLAELEKLALEKEFNTYLHTWSTETNLDKLLFSLYEQEGECKWGCFK